MRIATYAFGILLLTSATVFAQPVTDEVSQQAARLEAELGKYKDTAPEAANALASLVDIYHTSGRVFGLVRAGQQFVAAHPADPRHKDVMLKMLDGLEILSRDKEFAASCRQFLARYPQAAECPALEIRLADTLAQMEDRLRTGEACLAVWTRQPTTDIGRRYAVMAMNQFSAVGSAEAISRSAQLSEEIVDKLPAAEFARQAGWQGFYDWRRISQWAKANTLGTKLLQKGLGGDVTRQRDLHSLLAENYANLGQYANAAEQLRQARAKGDTPLLHYNLVLRMYQAGAKGAEFEPLVNEYVQKYAQRPDRWLLQSYLAHALLRDGDKPRALQMLAALLPFDAISNANASVFVQQNGAEPPQLAQSEQLLTAAIGQNKDHAAYLRYVLAFEVHRDRLKDLNKARLVIRDLLAQSPTDDGYTTGAIDWLLYNSANDDEFRADVARVVQVRRDNVQMATLREVLKTWATNARQNKDFKDKAAYVAAELVKADADPLVKAWLDQRNSQHVAGGPIREQLRQPATFNALNERLARALLVTQAEYYRHYAPAKDRPSTASPWGQLCQRFPQDFPAAIAYLEAATDYSPPEVCKEAALHLLKLEPPANAGDAWRRLMIAADRSADANLVKQAHAWMQKSQEKFGRDPAYASTIGDTLAKYQLENEAVQYWTAGMNHDRNYSESPACAQRLLARLKDPAQRVAFMQELIQHDTDYFGGYAMWLAADYFQAADYANFVRTLREARTRQNERPFRLAGFDLWTAGQWIDAVKQNTQLTAEQRQALFAVIRDLDVMPASAAAGLAIMELAPDTLTPMQKLQAYRHSSRLVGNEWYDWDRLTPFAQGALERKDYVAAATVASGMLAHIPNVDEPRKKIARDIVTQSYARMGSVGLTIDESSPLAPLFQAALYLRLGDERLAFDAYVANRPLFDEHRADLPVDLVTFVCDRLIAAGGDENHDHVEEILRGWLVKNSESKQVDDATKARVQLQLARNYFKAQRYDVARNEYTTVVNRYPNTPQATEAEFGVGETFMAQRVYDQAEQTFEKLARHPEVDVVVRAEFLRGVLAFRRGDRDEARDIFRTVLERVPNVELANQALYSLAEVYGAEERYIDQLNLLRTVGRLGRSSKRKHVPGTPLSIVVHDSDLGISRGHNRIPVRVTTEPGGDVETIFLTSSGAGKGLFRVDLESRLGQAIPNDHVLQLTGRDVIRCDYPPEFKSEFRTVPLSDVEIHMAADARFEAASSKIVEKQKQSFSEELRLESLDEENQDKRVSQFRPESQIKPGNVIYLRVKDADRDLTNEPDQVVVKLTADSGDQVQVPLIETGAHTGIFEATAKTGELPAGARATDTAIDHSPLMAIDRDPQTFWLSEPDGASPKSLTVDMKDLRVVSRVRISTPQVDKNSPVRGELLGSQDGEFWFRIAGNPPPPAVEPVSGDYASLRRRVYAGNYTQLTQWAQVVALTKNTKPVDDETVTDVEWQKAEDAEDVKKPFAAVWHGKLIQPRDGAARIRIDAARSALVLDGQEQLPLGPGGRSADVWLTAGAHDLTIFAANPSAAEPMQATWARADLKSATVTLAPFRKADFDLTQAVAKPRMTAAGIAGSSVVTLGLDTVQINKKTEQFGRLANAQDVVGNWQAKEDWLHWEFNAPAPGAYEVWMNFARGGADGAYVLEFGRQSFQVAVPDTGGVDKFRIERVGTVLIESAGKQTLAMKPFDIQGGYLLNLRGVTLKPASGAGVVVADTAWEFRFPAIPLRFTKLVVHEYRGEAVAINHVEVGGSQPGDVYIPTKTDVLTLSSNDVLELAGGDMVTVSYTDEFTQSETNGSQLLTNKLTATYHNASITSIAYDFSRTPGGGVQTLRKELMRIEPGERIVVEIVDYDQDVSDQRDTIRFQVMVNDDEPIELEATETESYTGVFTKEVDTKALAQPLDTDSDKPTGNRAPKANSGVKNSAADKVSAEKPAGPNANPKPADQKLAVKPGDRIYVRYLDAQNTFPGHPVPREAVVLANEPSEGRIRIIETRVVNAGSAAAVGPNGRPAASRVPVQPLYLPWDESKAVSGVAFEAPLTVEVIDPDAAKDSRSTVTVTLTTTDGAKVDVDCVVSGALTNTPQELQASRALEEGRFIGQVIMQLGGKNSADLVPVTAEMPRGLLGRPKIEEEAGTKLGTNLVTRVLNLSGQDVATANYRDERRPDSKPVSLAARARLISNGELACTDREYEKDIQLLHVGEKLFLKVTDADGDKSDARDKVTVEVTGDLGEHESVALEETLAHSGVFTGSLMLKAVDKPVPDNLDPVNPVIESYFGDTIRVRYVDPAASTESGTLEQSRELPVVVGTDGLVSAFTKTFNDETLAVETKFRIAESYFELFKSHKTLERAEEKNVDLEAGRRILREVMEDFPDPKYAPRIAYLLGQFAQELGQWDEAIKAYELILRQYAEHLLAPDAQYKLAQCYEESGDFDNALEAYVTLAATHPKSPLIPNVMIRISDYFYKQEQYLLAAQVGEKFMERFEGHQYAPRLTFRVGQCYYKSKQYAKAGQSFDRFGKRFSEDPLAADALFWSGESFRLAANNSEAFRRYNRCRWDYPSSEAAKYARGRLALPEMLQQFEAEANSVDQ